LLEKIEFSGRRGEQFNSVQSAYNKALQQASSDDFVLICGSNFVVAEVLESLQHDKD
jgi:folylpolyglutamate synthase/dihydropteroate synthase